MLHATLGGRTALYGQKDRKGVGHSPAGGLSEVMRINQRDYIKIMIPAHGEGMSVRRALTCTSVGGTSARQRRRDKEKQYEVSVCMLPRRSGCPDRRLVFDKSPLTRLKMSKQQDRPLKKERTTASGCMSRSGTT